MVIVLSWMVNVATRKWNAAPSSLQQLLPVDGTRQATATATLPMQPLLLDRKTQVMLFLAATDQMVGYDKMFYSINGSDELRLWVDDPNATPDDLDRQLANDLGDWEEASTPFHLYK